MDFSTLESSLLYLGFSPGTPILVLARTVRECVTVWLGKVHRVEIQMKRSKSHEVFSKPKIRVGAADEKSKEVPAALNRTRKPEKPPVIPPRPTTKALANAAKRSTSNRGRYVDVDLSEGHVTLRDAQRNGLPVKESAVHVIDSHTVTGTYVSLKLAQLSPLPSSRETLQGAVVTQTGNATTTRCTRAASENNPSSVQRLQSPPLKGKSSLLPPSRAKRSEPPPRPEPPKHHLDKPLPLPRNKLLTQSLQSSIATSRQQREADIAAYDYIKFEPRHVIVHNESANASLYTETQSGEPLIIAIGLVQDLKKT